MDLFRIIKTDIKIFLCVCLAVEDDAALVKHLGQSFRFSAVEVGICCCFSLNLSCI